MNIMYTKVHIIINMQFLFRFMQKSKHYCNFILKKGKKE